MANRPVRTWLPMALSLAIGIPCGNIAVRELRPEMDKWGAIFIGSLIGMAVGLIVFGVTGWVLRKRRAVPGTSPSASGD